MNSAIVNHGGMDHSFLLLTEENWPNMTLFDSCEEAQLEMMKTTVSHSFVTSVTLAAALSYPTVHEVIYCKRFSSLNKLFMPLHMYCDLSIS